MLGMWWPLLYQLCILFLRTIEASTGRHLDIPPILSYPKWICHNVCVRRLMSGLVELTCRQPQLQRRGQRQKGGGDKPPSKKSKVKGTGENKRKRSWAVIGLYTSLKMISLLSFWDGEFSGYINLPWSRGFLFTTQFFKGLQYAVHHKHLVTWEKQTLKILSLGDAGFLQFFRVISSDDGKNPFIIIGKTVVPLGWYPS